MPLLDAFQPQNDTAVENLLSQPEPTPKIAPAKSNVWSTITAAPRAMAAAAAETLAGATELVTAVGRSNMPGNIMNRAGPEVRGDYGAMTSEASRSLRNVAEGYRPDPLTAGTAENLVFGVTKGLTKAVGATLAAGPLGGALAFGTDQGLTKFDDLQREGVDDQTAAKAAFVEGAFSGASLLLPVAATGATTAATVAKTVGLVGVAGPGAFIAQQAATREILRSADYKGIAEAYDPLDPVGLAVATLIPAVFGGLHVRAGIKARGEAAPEARVEPTLGEQTPAPAVDEAIAAPDTRTAVDAAMTHNLTLLQDGEARRAPQYLNLPLPETSRLQADPTMPVAEAKPAEIQPPPAAENVAPAEPADPTQSTDPTVLRAQEAAPEEMAAARQLSQEGTDTELGHLDTDLLRVAAECALTTGTA
jgi:hypothetical protein